MRYVYMLTNTINGKVYVGQTKNPVGRKIGHFCCARRGNPKPLYASMQKYGLENFTFEVIEECSDETINDRERHWVSHYDSFNPTKGYNLTTGGDHCDHTEETRQKIRAARAKQIITDDHRKHISEGLLRTSQDENVRTRRREGQAKRLPPTEETLCKRAESSKAWIRDNPEAALLTRQKPRRCSRCHELGHNKRNCI